MRRIINEVHAAKIKELIAKGFSNKSIVEIMQIDYKITVNQPTIRDIKYGKTYYDVRPDLNVNIKSKVPISKNINTEKIADIKHLLASNEYTDSNIIKVFEISEKELREVKYGCSPYYSIATEYNETLEKIYPRKKHVNINKKIVIDIKKQFIKSNGIISLTELAAKYIIDKGTVSTIVNLKNYVDYGISFNAKISSILKAKNKKIEHKNKIQKLIKNEADKINQIRMKQKEEKNRLINSNNEIKKLKELLSSVS